MDGFDMGVAALLPFVAKTDEERRAVINTVGPTWEGNQVWFVLGGGAIFAAWPFVYAVSFSGFYLAMFLVLAALILRPVGFKYRSKKPSAAWRNGWDWALFVGGFVPALVFGVAIGNVLQGVPFSLDSDMRATYHADTIMGRIHARHADMILLHGGGTKGAEKIASLWAEIRKITQIVFKPDWAHHQKSAPFKRNDQLLKAQPIGLLAFKGNGIVENLIDKAKAQGIPVWRAG